MHQSVGLDLYIRKSSNSEETGGQKPGLEGRIQT